MRDRAKPTKAPNSVVQARWVDPGSLDPTAFHALYQGVAEAQGPAAVPTLLWLRADRSHLALGASQAAGAELDGEACRREGVAVVRRALGGGTVLVEPDQWCFVFVVPRDQAPASRERFFAACLDPVVEALRALGLGAERVGRGDIWVGGRKLLGSGAATIGRSHVLGAGVLMRFPAERFARLMSCPSEGYRQWLAEALQAGMTGWADHGEPPPETAFRDALCRAVERHHGWRFHDASLSSPERAAAEEARAEVAEVERSGGRRLVPDGVKVNQECYIAERAVPEGRLRVMLHGGRLVRLYLSALGELQVGPQQPGHAVDRDSLTETLAQWLPHPAATAWAERIVAVSTDIESMRDA